MIGLNKKTYRKKNSFMNDFTKNIAQALFNQDKINDLLRQETERAVNDLLEAELTAFLAMTLMQESAGIPAILEIVLIIARLIPNLERFKSKYREIAMASFTSTLCPIINSTPMS